MAFTDLYSKLLPSLHIVHLYYNTVFMMAMTKSFFPLIFHNLDCVLYAVGKPVYHKFTDQNYGAWLKDAQPRNDMIAEKIWATREDDHLSLFEYANKVTYKNNLTTKIYRLQFAFQVFKGL